jgi:glucose/arabinose dehydrogenase
MHREDFAMHDARRSARRVMGLGTTSTMAAAALAGAALAQAPAAPQPPPAWKQGIPKSMENSTLAPHAIPMTVTAPEKIPLDKLKVPPGFKVELWAHGMPGARMMTLGDKGTLFVGTRIIGRVYAVSDKAGKREHKILAQGLTQPNGVLWANGALYVAAINKVLRYDRIEERIANPPEPVDMTDKFNLPPDQHHGWKFLALGPDSKIYIPIGAPCNICEINPGTHGQIRRYNLDGSGMEIVARGVRNSVGFAFHPETKELWFTDNGRDWAGNEGPEDELNRLPAKSIGANFGYPYCHAQGVVDPDIKKPDACAGVIRPAALLGPHAAALGMRFYTGSMFPASYKNQAFIARRGSWNRDQKTGYDVLAARVASNGKVSLQPFLTGFLDDKANTFWGRPVDVQQMADGSLLVADEQNGAIYRVSYTSQTTAEGPAGKSKTK